MEKYQLPKHYKPTDACPFCGSTEDICSTGDFDKDKSSYTVVRHCNYCDAVWKDLYTYIATKVVDAKYGPSIFYPLLKTWRKLNILKKYWKWPS